MHKILIVDDHAMIRKGLQKIITSKSSGIAADCDEASSAHAALDLLSKKKYDCVLFDISMPDIDGLELLSIVKQMYPDLPVLMLSMHSEPMIAVTAFQLGAKGYLTKDEAADELVHAIKCILSGKNFLCQMFSEALLSKIAGGKSDPLSSLSKREQEVLNKLATGCNIKMVASDMNLSVKTVSTYKTRLFTKMGFRSYTDMINFMVTNGHLVNISKVKS